MIDERKFWKAMAALVVIDLVITVLVVLILEVMK
jgi:hypothetical protein